MVNEALQSGPIFGYMLLGLIIIFGPLIAERLRLPGLLGLLITYTVLFQIDLTKIRSGTATLDAGAIRWSTCVVAHSSSR